MLFLGQLILLSPKKKILCYQYLIRYNINFVFWSKGCAIFFLDSSETIIIFFIFIFFSFYPFFSKILGLSSTWGP